jgi:hypothetical protein
MFTDIDGIHHNTTIPRGKIDPSIPPAFAACSERYLIVNPPFVELIGKLEKLFVSAIRDNIGSKAAFYALALCRVTVMLVPARLPFRPSH